MIEDDDVMADDFIPDSEPAESEEIDIYELFFNEVTEIINSGGDNQALTEWMIGERLRKTLAVISDPDKAKKAFKELQKNIIAKFGKEYSEDKLLECLKLADEFPDVALFSEISNDLSLEHLKLVIEVNSDMERTFYCEMARHEKWSVEELEEKIKGRAFQKEYGED